jgi:hypothetical protein
MAPLRLSGRELAAFTTARAATTAAAAATAAAMYADADEDADEGEDGEDGEEIETTEEEAERILKAPSPLTCFQRSVAGKEVAKDAGDVHTTTYMKVRACPLAHPLPFFAGHFY